MLGKLFYRPPGGESWADIALRIRSFLRDLDDNSAHGTALVGTHDAVIFLFRYVIEGLDEPRLDRQPGRAFYETRAISRSARGQPAAALPKRPRAPRALQETVEHDLEKCVAVFGKACPWA